MALPKGDSIQWTYTGDMDGFRSIVVDFEAQAITGTETVCRLSADSLAQLRALAEAVEPEHALLQRKTYVQSEMMVVTLGNKHVTIEASSGEICAGPPKTLLDAMVALLHKP